MSDDDVTLDGMKVSPTTAAAYRYLRLHKELVEEYGEADSLAGLIVASAMAQSTTFPKPFASEVATRVATALGKYRALTEPVGEA